MAINKLVTLKITFHVDDYLVNTEIPFNISSSYEDDYVEHCRGDDGVEYEINMFTFNENELPYKSKTADDLLNEIVFNTEFRVYHKDNIENRFEIYLIKII